MEKFLLVIDAADDAAMFPVSGLRAVTCAADATVLLQFAPGIHDPTGDDADAWLITNKLPESLGSTVYAAAISTTFFLVLKILFPFF